MKKLSLIALASLGQMLMPNWSSAAVFTYEYTGQQLVCTADFGCLGPQSLPGYQVSLVIDEDLLGQSLLGSDIAFSYSGTSSPGNGDTGPLQGILYYQASYVQGSLQGGTICGSYLDLKTDYQGDIVTGNGGFCDGPPDGSFGMHSMCFLSEEVATSCPGLASGRPSRSKAISSLVLFHFLPPRGCSLSV